MRFTRKSPGGSDEKFCSLAMETGNYYLSADHLEVHGVACAGNTAHSHISRHRHAAVSAVESWRGRGEVVGCCSRESCVIKSHTVTD